jgi:hypothetical protein
MGSGNKRIITNTRERAVSTDLNRTQSLVVADAHEFNRWNVNRDILGDFYNFPGLQHAYTALPASSQFLVPHDCISGLMVDPTNAAGLLIDPGEAGFFVASFPNSNSDDSDYIQISDPGISSLATLPFVANAGPGIRWDIVECQPTEALLESASRDIYNTTTGQFTSSVVDKVRGGSLTYRMRQGTPGGGIPDIDSAWMPLAAIHVRTDATGFHQCDVYDIRPLINERCMHSPNHPKVLPASAFTDIGFRLNMDEWEFGAVPDAGINGHALTGYWRSHFGGYYTGGAIRCNSVSQSSATFGGTGVTEASYGFFNPQAAINQSSAFVPTANKWFTIGAFFPRGYPRWVRYSQAAISAASTNHLRITGRRIPQGPRGVMMVCFEGGRSNGVITPTPMPTAFGETESAWGYAVCEGYSDSATEFYPAEGGSADRRVFFPVGVNTPSSAGTPASYTSMNLGQILVIPAVIESSAGLTTVEHFIDRVYPVPPYAKMALVQFTVVFNFAAPGFVNHERIVQRCGVMVNAGPARLIECPGTQGPTNSNTSDSYTWTGAVWVPLSPSSISFDDSAVPPAGYTCITFSHSGTGAPSSVSSTARLLGYQI